MKAKYKLSKTHTFESDSEQFFVPQKFARMAGPPGIEPGTPGFLHSSLKARCSVLTELRAPRLCWFKKHDLRLFVAFVCLVGNKFCVCVCAR
jgi:hypothetical protein